MLWWRSSSWRSTNSAMFRTAASRACLVGEPAVDLVQPAGPLAVDLVRAVDQHLGDGLVVVQQVGDRGEEVPEGRAVHVGAGPWGGSGARVDRRAAAMAFRIFSVDRPAAADPLRLGEGRARAAGGPRRLPGRSRVGHPATVRADHRADRTAGVRRPLGSDRIGRNGGGSCRGIGARVAGDATAAGGVGAPVRRGAVLACGPGWAPAGFLVPGTACSRLHPPHRSD